MENAASINVLTQNLTDAGAKTIGFVGDREHCSSFYLRRLSCRNALWLAGLPVSDPYSILERDSSPCNEPDRVNALPDRMPHIPDAFVCVDDCLAIRPMIAPKRRGLSVPVDLMNPQTVLPFSSFVCDPRTVFAIASITGMPP